MKEKKKIVLLCESSKLIWLWLHCAQHFCIAFYIVIKDPASYRPDMTNGLEGVVGQKIVESVHETVCGQGKGESKETEPLRIGKNH